uniref:squalene synthase n=1 Tax=Timspurckia oligopyrenoides TaxID=708627 RepID=A0A7S0ZHI8_9RHOD|mmetsp:Transcript_5259/g.9190  ORF Transcript_5259/g.9190 Transcript_5259/m.9190 type:complete len:475 (+) Transcript_5259:63-1487(+)|eukprot:CAMPEP_0182443758 /NCGR_PEP_ID=MMETSP1172-20130603/2398_1 /TAXON_ID=708627 /ORGANISM="Timspurckia oligopyrenoides, Strain CCMP3278" /LENGTH=474 /DNA_ID=CAMNT_0024639123 /DNA_START=35 /DNA_END=1459 /DNA_ORIENTATION=-
MGIVKELVGAAHRPDEALAMVRFKLKARAAYAASVALRSASDPMTAKWEFCYEYLGKVSRSFAMVIMELDDELRDPVCIFYLVLRALDTVEDDTAKDSQARIDLCTQFYKKLELPEWSTSEYGYAHEKELLEQFSAVLACFGSLPEKYRKVISDITRRMGKGMAEHIHDKECISVADYDQYCFYVAGLVGIGLSSMFVASGREDRFFVENDHLSISMGLFLQKVNIIRDYLEDIHDARTFWPREIWSEFSPTGELSAFKHPEYRMEAVECLNAMITDALRHVPDCIQYMSRIQNSFVFNFVAIPQVMAIGTLAECFNNPLVFEGIVKLRRGLTAKLVMKTKTMSALFKLYFDFAMNMKKKCQVADASYELTAMRLNSICDLSLPYIVSSHDLQASNWLFALLLVFLSVYLVNRRRDFDVYGIAQAGLPEIQDMAALGALFLCLAYMLVFFGLQFMRPTIERTESSLALSYQDSS